MGTTIHKQQALRNAYEKDTRGIGEVYKVTQPTGSASSGTRNRAGRVQAHIDPRAKSAPARKDRTRYMASLRRFTTITRGFPQLSSDRTRDHKMYRMTHTRRCTRKHTNETHHMHQQGLRGQSTAEVFRHDRCADGKTMYMQDTHAPADAE